MQGKRKYAALFIVGVASYLALGEGAFGANSFSQVNGGNWNDTATWDTGAVPGGVDTVIVSAGFAVVVTDTQSAFRIFTRADLTINGDLNVGADLFVGSIIASSTVTTGGASLSTGLSMSIDGGSTYVHDGTVPSQTSMGLNVFVGGSGTGELEIRGSAGPFSVGGAFFLNDTGTLRITPTADGAAGLTPIVVTSNAFLVGIGGGSTLVLDDSLYTPQVGDSWVVLTATTVFDSVTNLVAPAGVTISQTVAKGTGATSLTITVTAAPAPELPAASYWGLAILMSLLPVLGVFYVMRRKTAAPAID